ncbi:MAG: TolC family protein, partial [Alphaproteobacteria bacterium]|nr:TolC family protein [Alphaproteobacteria bacterium]
MSLSARLIGPVAVLLPVFGTPCLAESLNDALGAVYQRHPRLAAERAATRATDENVAVAASGWRPEVTLSAGPSRVFSKYTDTTSGVVSSVTTTRQGGLGISQNVYDFGRTAEAVRGADARVLAARAVLVATEGEVLLEGARAYLDVAQGRQVARLNRNSLALLRRQLDSAQASFARRLATRTDVAQAEARVADAEAALRAAELSLRSAEMRFEELVGAKPGNVSFPTAMPALPATRED